MNNTELISNFWTFISKRLDAEAPLADWRLIVGHGLDFAKLQQKYLVLTGKSANLITCPKPCSPACGFRKVCEYEGQYEAVCREWPLKSYVIEETDAQIFTVNTAAIVPELVRIFKIRPHSSPFNNEKDTWQLGEVVLPGGKSATVYFTLKIWDHEVTDLIYRFNCKENRSYVLLITARKVIHPTSDAILKGMGAVFVPLNEVTDFNADAELRLIQECNLAYLISPPVANPAIKESSGPAWLVPPGTKWEDLSIHFLDAHNLTVTIGDKTRTFSYGEMGMAHGSSKQPLDRWMLLYAMSNASGQYKLTGKKATIISKQKQLLCKSMIEFFGINDDPIYWDEDHLVYICKFQLYPDSRSSQWHAHKSHD